MFATVPLSRARLFRCFFLLCLGCNCQSVAEVISGSWISMCFERTGFFVLQTIYVVLSDNVFLAFVVCSFCSFGTVVLFS